MTAAEREALYKGFTEGLGTYAGKTWKNEYVVNGKTYFLFVNGGYEAAEFSESLSYAGAKTLVLFPEGEAAYKDGSFSLRLPPGGIGFFALEDLPSVGLFLDDLALLYLADGAVWRSDETAVLYKEYDGIPEVIGFVENGETVELGSGTYALKVFSWTAPLKPLAAAITHKTP